MSKSDRMLISEIRKLHIMIPELMDSWGLKAVPNSTPYEPNGFGEYVGYSKRYDCPVSVRPLGFDQQGHPWLACRYEIPYPRPELAWNHPLNANLFRDIFRSQGISTSQGGSKAGCCGKDNAHVFHRLTAAEAYQIFHSHLWGLIGEDRDNSDSDQFVGGMRKSKRDAIMAAPESADRYVYADGDPSKRFGFFVAETN